MEAFRKGAQFGAVQANAPNETHIGFPRNHDIDTLHLVVQLFQIRQGGKVVVNRTQVAPYGPATEPVPPTLTRVFFAVKVG